MSLEQNPAPTEEKWWTTDAPINIVRRHELVERGDTVRLADVDTLIAFINEDMDDGYMIKTFIYQREGWTDGDDDVQENGTRVYQKRDDSEFDLLGVTGMSGVFYGDKIELIDEQPILVRYREVNGEMIGVGISLTEAVKIVSDENIKNNIYINHTFNRLRRIGNG